jgi:hypothetical protein
MALLLRFESEYADNNIIIFLDECETIIFQKICSFIDVYFLVFIDKYKMTLLKEIAIQTYEDCKIINSNHKENFMMELNNYNKIIEETDLSIEQKMIKIIERKFNTTEYLGDDEYLPRKCRTLFEKINKYNFIKKYVIVEKTYEESRHYIKVYNNEEREILSVEYLNLVGSKQDYYNEYSRFIDGDRKAIMEELVKKNKYSTILKLVEESSRNTKIMIVSKSEFE